MNIDPLTQDRDDFRFHTGCGKPVDQIWGIKSIDRKRADLLGHPCGKCFRGEK